MMSPLGFIVAVFNLLYQVVMAAWDLVIAFVGFVVKILRGGKK